MGVKNWPVLITFIVVCQLTGVIGALFTSPSLPTWYNQLAKPSVVPPGFLFSIVWFILYTLMGLSAYLIWEKGLTKPFVRAGLLLFAVQLALNLLWSIVFFFLHAIFPALLVLGVLWLTVSALIYVFYKTRKVASYLLLPYIFWLSFAFYMNYTIWLLNR